MTAPCAHGVISVGDCPVPLRICVRPGAMLAKDIPLVDPLTMLPVDWPVGMTAWLRVFSGGFDQTYPLPITDDILRVVIAGTDTVEWPRNACVQIWLEFAEYPADPIVWAEGTTDRGCC